MMKDDIGMNTVDRKWIDLFGAAREFEKTAPWNWMNDSDMFGVIYPDTGEVGYCCVMGGASECYGLAVYLGAEGYEAYLKIMSGEYDGRFEEVVHINKSLVLTFDGKETLEKPDIDLMERLKVEWKGRAGCPCFRSYRPGYLPWYLTEGEAGFLEICIRQATEFSLLFKNDPAIFRSSDAKSCPAMEEDTDGRWKCRWIEPERKKKEIFLLRISDAKRIKDILDTSGRSGQTWEMDISYSPAYVAGEGKRPYFPMVFYAVDRESFFILNANIFSPDRLHEEMQEQFFKTIESNEILPAEILVRKEELYAGLKLAADQLGVKIRKKFRLKTVDNVKKHMTEHFSGMGKGRNDKI